MRMQRTAIWILAFLIAIPTIAIANGPPDYGPASVHTPNDQVGTRNVVPGTYDRTMSVEINLRARSAPPVETEIICDPEDDGEKGEVVAERLVEGLCADAVNAGFTCTGVRDFVVPCAGSACCDPGFAASNQSVGITCKSLTTASFSLSRLASDVAFYVLEGGAGSTGGTELVSVKTRCGNTVAVDLWPWVIVQLLPNGVNGVVYYDVYHDQGGLNPRIFSVNTALYSTSKDLHDAIADGFAGLGLNLNVQSVDGAYARANSPLLDPADGAFVVIRNAKAQVTEIQSRPLMGQSSELQTGDAWDIPTLSEWGMIFVVALLLATGYWMLRRRKQATGSA